MPIPDWFREENKEKNIEFRPRNGDAVLDEIEKLQNMIRGGANENEIQNILKNNPFLLSGAFRSGHGTYAFAEKKLGNKYVIDWAIANGDSAGFLWHLIELECPQSCPFNKDGTFSKATRKGLKQIRDWRIWVQRNISIATRSRAEDGEGLFDISPRSPGQIIVGQSTLYKEIEGYQKYNDYRKAEREESGISIESYDRFLENCKFRWTLPPYK